MWFTSLKYNNIKFSSGFRENERRKLNGKNLKFFPLFAFFLSFRKFKTAIAEILKLRPECSPVLARCNERKEILQVGYFLNYGQLTEQNGIKNEQSFPMKKVTFHVYKFF